MMNSKPLSPKRQPLKEHSLSDLNRVNSKPTIRLIDGVKADKIYEKSPFPRMPSQILRPTAPDAARIESPELSPTTAVDSRPPTREGFVFTGPKTLHVTATHRLSISTTTSCAETLVANSVFSPTSQRFSSESLHKTHFGTIEPLDEIRLETTVEERLDIDENAENIPPNVIHEIGVPAPALDPNAAIIHPSAQVDALYTTSSAESIEEDRPITPEQDSRPSTSHQIRYVSSSESIRQQYASIRPAAVPSQSDASLWSNDVSDQLPSLSVARKRAHGRSSSLTSFPSQSRMPGSHLSTIASESDMHQPRFLQESLSMSSPMWPRKRRTTVASSTYSDSIASPRIGASMQTSSSYGSLINNMRNEADMHMPEPLFSSSGLAAPPMNNTSEIEDTIGELQPPRPLREKRSGYFLRSKSRAEFQSSYTLADETWSSSRFPQWARNFYAGRSVFRNNNASRMTIGTPYANENTSTASLPRPPTRGKQFSQHATVDSLTRPVSGLSTWETIRSVSPAASRLPSILRPKAKQRERTGLNVMTASRNSVEISELPGDIPVPGATHTRKLNTKRSFRNPLRSHPRLTESDAGPVPEQIQGQTTLHGGILSADPSYIAFPRLVQNRRLQQNGNMWRVPSFDEPLRENWLGRCNRQILAFCFGFLFPPLWIVASFLALPHRHRDDFTAESASVAEIDEKGREKPETELATATWSWNEERIYLKAKWWQTLNRVMSVVGIGIMALIVSFIVLSV